MQTQAQSLHNKPPMTEEEREREVEINALGMWVFLAGEVLFFGAVFTAYEIYRHIYTPVFESAALHLNLPLGGINTAILLTSSFMMALAVYSAQMRRRSSLVTFLVATLILGAVFLGIKGYEWSVEFRDNLFPGLQFIFPGGNPGQARIFFSFYFILTGLHAIHMLIGMGLITMVAVQAGIFKKYGDGRYSGVEMVGLFWHFVDIVWIFIFPLLYLIGRS